MKSTRDIAEAVAKSLFTNGEGKTAYQLRLMVDNERDGGGWAFKPCVNHIEKIITPMINDTKKEN